MEQRTGTHAGLAGTILGTSVYLAAVTLWFRIGWPLEAPIARAAGSLLLLLAAGFYGLPFGSRRASSALGVVLGTLLLASLRPGPEGASITCLGLTLALTLHSDDRRRDLTRVLLGGAALFSTYMLARLSFPVLWRLEQWLAAGLAGMAGALLDEPLRWGPSASGLHVVVAGASLLGAGALLGVVHRARALAAAALMPLLPVLYMLLIVPHGFELGSLANGGVGVAKLFAAQAVLLPVIAMLAVWPLAGRSAPVSPAVRENLPPFALGHAFTAALAPLALFGATTNRAADAPADVDATKPANRVLIHASEGLSNFDSAGWDRFGYGAQGMYGHLIELLEASGRRVQTAGGELDAADLEGITTLVMLVPMPGQTAPPNVIEDFVAGGGSLLLLSDHTDLYGAAGVCNEILRPFGMEFRFDTAMESARGFDGNLEVFDNGVLPTSTRPDQLEILHGASLRLTGPAEPVIVGRLMFGDIGDRRNGGSGAYLGDYRLDPRGEQLGDLVLAAKAEYGNGRVLAFGDTSGFQNVSLPRSSASVLRVFDWLDGRGAHRWGHGLAGLLGLVVLSLGLRRGRAVWTHGGAAALGLLWFLGGDAHAEADNARVVESLTTDERVCLVYSNGLGHAEGEHFEDTSFDGLLVNAARGGLLPVVGDAEAIEDLDACELIIVMPTAAIDEQLADRVYAFVERGGTLVVSSGYEESAGVKDLLAAFGLSILDVPMGAAPVLTWRETGSYDGARFDEAWPVAVTAEAARSSESLYDLDGFSLVRDRHVGDGRVVVIGDSWFLTDDNLEGESTFTESNIHFLADHLGWR